MESAGQGRHASATCSLTGSKSSFHIIILKAEAHHMYNGCKLSCNGAQPYETHHGTCCILALYAMQYLAQTLSGSYSIRGSLLCAALKAGRRVKP